MNSSPAGTESTRTAFPHSEIPGSKVVYTSPRLIAADHVLRRLSAPRHPPHTLNSLTTKVSFTIVLCQTSHRVRPPRRRPHSGARFEIITTRFTFRTLFNCQRPSPGTIPGMTPPRRAGPSEGPTWRGSGDKTRRPGTLGDATDSARQGVSRRPCFQVSLERR